MECPVNCYDPVHGCSFECLLIARPLTSNNHVAIGKQRVEFEHVKNEAGARFDARRQEGQCPESDTASCPRSERFAQPASIKFFFHQIGPHAHSGFELSLVARGGTLLSAVNGGSTRRAQ